MKKEKHKLYIVRKYVKARTVKEALRLEKTTEVHDVWIDESWKDKRLTEAIGFEMESTPEDDIEET